MKMDLDAARRHWHLRSGLATPSGGPVDQVIKQTGWLRTLGGVDVYLAARARVPGLRRADLEALVEQSKLRVIPAVRGCIYLVPSAHVPLALHVASQAWRKTTEKELAKVGSSWKKVEAVGAEVAKALKDGPLTTDKIRKAVKVPSFGDAGKKIGLSSPLPIALRDLEFKNVVERTLEGGRLDTERYQWRLARDKLARPPADPGAELARIFARQAGPFPLADFAWWAGMTQRDARAAIEGADLAAVSVTGYADEAWMLPEDVKVKAEPSDAVSLLSFEDNYQVPRGSRWLVDPAQWSRPVSAWGSSKPSTLGEAKHMATRTVIVGGKLAGIWEMDPDADQILWATFSPVPSAARAQIDRLATDTAKFLGEIGHALSFSLDTEDEVRKRASEVADVHRDPAQRNRPRTPARRRRKS